MQIAAASPAYVVARRGAGRRCSRRRRRSTARRWRTRASRPTCIDKIVEGKLGSYYSQVVLPDQPSIRDPKMTVAGRDRRRQQGARRPVAVTRFARLKVGEAAAVDTSWLEAQAAAQVTAAARPSAIAMSHRAMRLIYNRSS